MRTAQASRPIVATAFAAQRSARSGGGKRSSSSTSSRNRSSPPKKASPPFPGKESAGPRGSFAKGVKRTEVKAKPPPSPTTTTTATKNKKVPSPTPAVETSDSSSEAHKTFDEALIVVRAGSGGRGEISKPGSGTWVDNFKFKAGDGKSSRRIFLAAGEPARGGEGGSVVLLADPSVPDLLHLRHGRKNEGEGGGKGKDGALPKFTARDGRSGDASLGTKAPRAPGAAKRLEREAAVAAGGKGNGPDAPPLVVRVPLGTVVKRAKGNNSSGGTFLGELLTPGQTLVVARGGKGGSGVVAPRKGAAAAERARAAQREARRLRRVSGDGGSSFDAFAAAVSSSDNGNNSDSFLALEEEADAFYEAGADAVIDDDANAWKLDAQGGPGEGPLKLRLLLRVVADVGLVGAPNAGKSSMLAALTRARPEVAPYPFTTLRPNLGVLAAPLPMKAAEEEEGKQQQQQPLASFVFGGFGDDDGEDDDDDEEEEEEDIEFDVDEEFAFGGRRRRSNNADAKKTASLLRGSAGAPNPVLADLPGLIEGAASGKGLGRAFLRHLRRARVILHVVDASTADPVSDYSAIRRELALYNPDYLSRPHVVALNKADLFLSSKWEKEEGEDDDNVARNGTSSGLVDPNASPPIPELAERIRSAARDVFEEAVLGRDSDSDEDEGDEDEDEEGARAAKAKAAPSSTSESEALSLPRAVVWTSADSDLGLEQLRQALAEGLASTVGKPAPGGVQRRSSPSFGQRAARRARRDEALAAEVAAGRRGRDYEEAEAGLDW